ncbi:MAG: MFS transporter [Porticoccaceae bacterium]|nr:MFS transporter [Porticoccaceae bacterium]
MSGLVASVEEPSVEDLVRATDTFRVTQLLVIVSAICLNMLDGFDVTAMAFSAHQIGMDLQLSPNSLGIVFSVALAGMMLGAICVAPLSDLYGRRTLILACSAVVGATTILTAFSSSIWELIILRAITGIGVGGVLASLCAMAAEYSPEKYRSLAVVCVTAGYPLGATAGGFIAAALIPAYGWQSVFLAGGSLTVLLVGILYFTLPESLKFLLTRRPSNALARVNTILRRLKVDTLSALPEADESQLPVDASVKSLLTPEMRKQTLCLWAAFFFCFICLYFLMSWIPKLVVDAGFSEALSIYASVAFNGGGVLGILLLGWMSARFSLSRLIGTALVAATIFMFVFATTSGIKHLIVYLLLIGLLLQSGFTGLYAVAAKIYPTEVRATGVGWAIGLGRFGAVVGPYVGGILIQWNVSMEANFIIFSLPLLISGLLAFKLAVR